MLVADDDASPGHGAPQDTNKIDVLPHHRTVGGGKHQRCRMFSLIAEIGFESRQGHTLSSEGKTPPRATSAAFLCRPCAVTAFHWMGSDSTMWSRSDTGATSTSMNGEGHFDFDDCAI